MDFRVLGPLDVTSAGSTVDVRGRIGKRLLAVLLIDAGRGVSMARLIEGIWDGDPPDTALRQVRHAASRLRKALGAERVESAGDGYRISMDGATCDALRFEQAVREARDLFRHGDSVRGLAILGTALDLWQGRAFSGLDGRVIDAEAARLEEARLAAMEDRLDAELKLGHHSQVISELRRLISDHPQRQRLTGQLMLALYRDGRTPEALEVYEQLRSRLADGLGLDPDVPLRERHAAILRGDRDLMVAEPETTPPPHFTRAPTQLPVKPAGFVGRSRQLSTLDKLLTDSDRAAACVVAGPAGAGKTALAIHWAHQVRDRFPDGQLFANLRGFDRNEPATAHDILGRFIRALQFPDAPVPADLDEASALYRSLLDGKRVLVVLDNASDVAQIRPLMPASDSCFTVVTSRNSLPGLTALDGVSPVNLAPLHREEAIDLFAAAVGAERLRADFMATDRLADLCGDLPLALRIAAAYLTHHPDVSVNHFATQMVQTNRLDMLTIDGDPHATVASAIDASFAALDVEAQELFLRLGVIPGEDFSRQLVVAIDHHDEFATRRVLDRLASAHLVEAHQPGRYRLHDLTKEYAHHKAVSSIDSTTLDLVRERVINWYYDRRFDMFSENHTNIVAAFNTWRESTESWKLLAVLTLLAEVGLDVSMVDANIDAVLAAAIERRDRPAIQAMYNCKAEALARSGDYQGNLAYARLVMDAGPDPTGHYESCLAVALLMCEQPTESELAFLNAIERAKDFNNEYTVLSSARNLGHNYRIYGRNADAERVLTEALSINTETCPASVTFSTKMALVKVFIDTGQIDRAFEFLDPYLTKTDYLAPDWYSLVYLLRAQIHIQRKAFDQALNDLRCSLDGSERAYSVMRSRTIELTIVRVLCELASPKEASTWLEHIDLGGARNVLAAEYALAAARVRNGFGEFAAAKEHADKACELFSEREEPRVHAEALLVLADSSTGLGEHTAAEATRRQALDIFTRIGAPEADEVQLLLERGERLFVVRTAEAQLRLGEHAAAEATRRRAVTILRELALARDHEA